MATTQDSKNAARPSTAPSEALIERPRRGVFKPLALIAIAVGLIALAAGGYWRFNGKGDPEGVRIGEVTQGTFIQRVTLAGNVSPQRRTIITAPYAGYIKEIYVKNGQKVRRGEPLVSVVQSLASPEAVFPMRAPYDGTVVQILKSEGEFVPANDMNNYIMRIDDMSRLFVIGKAPEFDMVKVKVGQEAVVKPTSVLDRQYKGMIREVSIASLEKDRWANNQNVEYPIRVEIMDADAELKPGMSTLMDVIALKKENVLLLDQEFVNEENGNFFATLANGEKRPIKVGHRNDQSFEVIEGLKAGDRVRQVDFLNLVKQK
jgi:multidrug efflux pump subunit AcrA (membrane-fusion protein)